MNGFVQALAQEAEEAYLCGAVKTAEIGQFRRLPKVGSRPEDSMVQVKPFVRRAGSKLVL
jgi:hypothetical protein